MSRNNIRRPLWLCACVALALPSAEAAAQKADDQRYLTLVRRYADTMLEQAAGKRGPVNAPLFGSCLDRQTAYFLAQPPPAPGGIRTGDRVCLAGSNPQHDQGLYLLLYRLSEVTGEPRYAAAADAALQWFLTHAQSPATGLYPWGEHACWDIRSNRWYSTVDSTNGTHEMFEAWLLGERSYRLAPTHYLQFGLGLWDHQIGDHQTGDFSRHAGYAHHRTGTGNDFQRHAGFYLQVWSELYGFTRDERLLKPIDVLLGRYEAKRHPQTGIVPGGASIRPTPTAVYSSTASSLSLAVSCAASAARLPEPLDGRMTRFAETEDATYLKFPHFPDRPAAASGSRLGFLLRANALNGEPYVRGGGKQKRIETAYSTTWEAAYGAPSTAYVAALVSRRFDQCHKPGYRQLLLKAADLYVNQTIDTAAADVWPSVPADIIQLLTVVYRETGQAAYRASARQIADQAIQLFWGDAALPRASSRTDHYETITGSPDLALALLELHQALQK